MTASVIVCVVSRKIIFVVVQGIRMSLKTPMGLKLLTKDVAMMD